MMKGKIFVKKRMASILLALCMVLALLPGTARAAEETSGKCGDNVTWAMDGSGTLTISGEGPMYDTYGENWEILHHWPWGSIKNVVITEGVTYIGNYTFCNCRIEESVTLPNNVTSIGDSAFAASGLKSINLPDTITNIGEGAFTVCNFTSINIPAGLNRIEAHLFSGCSKLSGVVIPNTVTAIGEYAFFECHSLTDISVPEGVASIGRAAFADCRNLGRISLPSSVTEIGEGIFGYYDAMDDVVAVGTSDKLAEITIAAENPAFTVEDNILFSKDMTRLLAYPAQKANASYAIPDSIKSIDAFAFTGNRNLASIVIPDGVTHIGTGAFAGNHSLTSVTIPEGITSIAAATFCYNDAMTSIYIPKSVNNIEYTAFHGCTALTDVYFSGTESEWDAIEIGFDNDCLVGAAVHCAEGIPAPTPPAEPEQPVTPVSPVMPDAPIWPAVPAIPSRPSPLEEPRTPEQPAAPTVPAQPETPQPPAIPAPIYRDVPPTAWYSEAASYVSTRGLMTGTSAAEFSPTANMTRAMVWTVLFRLDGADVSGSGAAWYGNAQAWSKSKGVSDGSNPNGSVTREELATMLWRYMGSSAASADLGQFGDSALVSGWASGAVQWAVSAGLLEGSDGNLNPNDTATRAEVAAILMRFCENVVK